jgi:hypothetical protein
MSIEKRTAFSQLTIQPDGVLQLRFDKQIVEDGNVLSSSFHRTVVEPGGDLEAQIALVNEHLKEMGCAPVGPEVVDRISRIVAAEHGEEVIKAYVAAQATAREALQAAPAAQESGRAMIGAALLLGAVALSGCAGLTVYVQQHAAGLAATALVAGTGAQVSGALINADELERRIEQRAAPDENKAKR